MPAATAICVLGCRPGTGAFRRRVRAAIGLWVDRADTLVVACGGRAWGGIVEADELARLLAEGGVAEGAIVRERCSLDTRDNARFAAAMLARRGVSDVVVVTCSWHLARATLLFRAAGLHAEGFGVEPPNATRFERIYWPIRERISTWKDLRRKMTTA